jgi:sporulation protein YlmC with PRC-barrel domain
MTLTVQDVKTWRGMKMVDADGDKIGTIEDIYFDRQTGEPEWATVRTGLLGTRVSFVPIAEAEVAGDREVRVPFQKEQVKDAPNIEADGELSPEEERQLYEHYGRGDYGDWQGEDRTLALDLPDNAEQRGRFERSGGGGDEPPIVGVRLRRLIVVAVPPPPPGGQDQPAAGPPPA